MTDMNSSATLDTLMAAVDDQAKQAQNLADGIDTCWILVCSTLVVIMQVGFAYVEAGNVRVKNVRSILLKNTIDYVIGGIMFFTIGCGVARGKSLGGFIGIDSYLDTQPDYDESAHAVYQATTLFTSLFACTASTIISGSIAERMSLRAYMLVSAISPVLLFSLPAHWVWNTDGFLNSSTSPYFNMSDFAGGAVVHMVGGVAALTAAWFTGPRIGRFHSKSGFDHEIEGHSVVLGGLGAWLIIFGWFGFNAGSSLGLSSEESASYAAVAALNTFLAIIMGAFVSVLYQHFVIGKLNLGEMFNSMLAGAAGITASCAYVSPLSAMCIGFIATLVYIISVPMVARKFKIDDPVNAISVHLCAGTTGTIMVGFFHATEGLFFAGTGYKLAAQVIGVAIIMANTVFWTGGTLLLYTLLVGPVRVEEKIEIAGCDIELDGIGAYETGEDVVHLKYTAIAANPGLNKEFSAFLKFIYCHQTVDFLNDLASFEKGISDLGIDSQTEAHSIYDTYISYDATDPLNIPEWQITQVKNALDNLGGHSTSTNQGQAMSTKSSSLQRLFTVVKNEVHSILDNTIATHFSTTPAYQKFIKGNTKRTKHRAPLHFLNKLWCCRRGKKISYGRARPFDPFKKFKHTEVFSDGESDDEDHDPESSLGMSRIAPTVESDDDYE